jgi:hypothetical protein
MREFTYGSVRGAAPKGGPYRDSRKIDFSDIPELSDRQLSSMPGRAADTGRRVEKTHRDSVGFSIALETGLSVVYA